VRRRAVFQWRDVARKGTLEGYAIQKIVYNGATYVPLSGSAERIDCNGARLVGHLVGVSPFRAAPSILSLSMIG
jgi:hypothetical protein